MRTIINRVKIALFALTLSAIMVPAISPSIVGAQVPDRSKTAACESLGGCDRNSGNSISSLLSTVIELLSWIVGVISIIMVIVGGFKFIVSSGDPAGAKSAKNTVIYALVGLAVAALAQILVRFVLSQV